MADSITSGVLSISVAPLASDGGPGTVFTTVGYTDRDQETSITEGDPTTTDKYSNESDTPLYTITTPGVETIQFSVIVQRASQLQAWFGGTVTGTPAVWTAPDSRTPIERTVRIPGKVGGTFQYNRVKFTPKKTYPMGPDGWFTINVTGQVLQPLKAGVAVSTFTEATAPV